jgi:hypothetical protein
LEISTKFQIDSSQIFEIPPLISSLSPEEGKGEGKKF